MDRDEILSNSRKSTRLVGAYFFVLIFGMLLSWRLDGSNFDPRLINLAIVVSWISIALYLIKTSYTLLFGFLSSFFVGLVGKFLFDIGNECHGTVLVVSVSLIHILRSFEVKFLVSRFKGVD